MQYTIADVSGKNPITLEANKSLYDARDLMLRYNISRVVTLKENQKIVKEPIGIITEKDIVRFALSYILDPS